MAEAAEDLAAAAPLPVPAQLETQLGKCKTVRPSTYYKSRQRSKAVSTVCTRLFVCARSFWLLLCLCRHAYKWFYVKYRLLLFYVRLLTAIELPRPVCIYWHFHASVVRSGNWRGKGQGRTSEV